MCPGNPHQSLLLYELLDVTQPQDTSVALQPYPKRFGGPNMTQLLLLILLLSRLKSLSQACPALQKQSSGPVE